MMRFLLALSLSIYCVTTMVSCSTAGENESDYEETEPIDASEADATTSESGEDVGSEEDEFAEEVAEVEGEESAPAQEPAEEQAAAAAEPEEDLDAELEEGEPEQVAEGEEELEEFEGEELAQAEEEAVAPVPVEEPPAPEKAHIRDIRFVANSAGGTVVIETSKVVSYQTRMNPSTRQFVIELAGVELPPSLQRPYMSQGAGSRVGSINAYQSEGSDTARVVIQMTGPMNGEPIVQQEGTALVVIPPAPPVVTQAPPPPAPVAPTSSEPKQALAARTLDEFLTGNQRFFGRAISLQVKDADVRDVVNFLGEESGANVVMSDDIQGKISLKLRRIPWDQALVTIMRTKGYGYVRQGNVLRISSLKKLQEETEAANKIIEAQKNIVPSIVEVIPVSYAAIDDLTKNLNAFLSKEGKIVADNRTSTIIVTDKAEVVDRVKKLVKTLDIAPPQVSIESKIVEAREEFSNFVGVNWGFTGAAKTIDPSGGANGGPLDLTLKAESTSLTGTFAGVSPFSMGVKVGVLDVFGDLSASLTLAERDSLAKVISAPRISTMNREKSTILQQGENVSIMTNVSPTGEKTTSEKRTPFALELSVTPQITSDGGVIMDLDVKREFLGPVINTEIQARAVNRRSAKTKILVRNGQTAVIGGIYTNDELESENGIPLLKEIPLLGWLFKSRNVERAKNELLIFMTPRIMASDLSVDLSSTPAAEGTQ